MALIEYDGVAHQIAPTALDPPLRDPVLPRALEGGPNRRLVLERTATSAPWLWGMSTTPTRRTFRRMLIEGCTIARIWARWANPELRLERIWEIMPQGHRTKQGNFWR